MELDTVSQKKLGSLHLLIKIITVYISRRVAEYASCIWSKRRKLLERSLHNATRAALHAPYDNRSEIYRTFDERLMLTFEERRTISSIIHTIKKMRGAIDTNLTSQVNNSVHCAYCTLSN